MRISRLRMGLLASRQLPPIESRLFVANALQTVEPRPRLALDAVDIVITDIPYGQRTVWHEAGSDAHAPGPEWQLLEALRCELDCETL